MFERIKSAIPKGNKRYPLKYRRMVHSISDRMEYVVNRYDAVRSQITPGMEMLHQLICSVDMNAADKCDNDLSRFIQYFQFAKNSQLQLFDPVANGILKGGKFISTLKTGGLPPPEIILNVDCDDPVNSLPFDKPWEQWKEVRAVCMIYHDSLELIDEYSRSMWEYKQDVPTFLVVSVDPAILLSKYYKYWKDCQEKKIQPDVVKFLKDYEYVHFFDDMLDIWIMNLLDIVFENPESSVDEIMKVLVVPKRIATDSMLHQGIEGIKDYIFLVKSGLISPADFIEINWFINGSIKSRIDILEKWCVLPDRHSYLWEETLMWLPYIRFMLVLTEHFQDGALNQILKDRCKELYMRKFKYSCMPQVSNSESIKEFVEAVQSQVELILAN